MPDVMVDTEYFVICSSATHVQIRAIVDAISAALEEAGVELLRMEGRGGITPGFSWIMGMWWYMSFWRMRMTTTL